ncbi:phosphocholine-specific phospholipase C [Gluconobacter cerinus]|uniref:phosphocholine-specific phospholipase C n=1 Tax=Gluconobacter cerinus TaxID=38307 RepID=UPI001B8B6E0F|nr:phospholipase C, phosphocholine-specific [Gluconobacter cerinus]MBS0982964.1 phospholipase C, phosphocholine-specific [Gluconobacter cerinus]
MTGPLSSRRRFLELGAAFAAAGSLPGNLRQALAVPANRKTGTIQDVEHVVILMQENRSFDHYFGCLQGVRGYGDPRAAHQPDGTSVFAQKTADGATVMPFRMNTVHTSSACISSLDHSWKGSQKTWNEWDCWVPHKTAMTMGHFTRRDIPYYYALADAFTICDAYHCSIFGPTNPNRLFLFSGTNGLSVGHDGRQAVENVDDGNTSADMRHDNPKLQAFQWTTYAEELQKAGVSWKVYQEYDNFGDNALAGFSAFRGLSETSWQYQQGRAIVEGSTAANAVTSEGRFLVEAFEKDIASGTLPQVSWIVPSAALSEHPNAPPGYGEHLISRLMDVFVRHPDVWSKTVFILNYDENDGFFDHVPAPVPALHPDEGSSTVSVSGETYHAVAVGLGPRVPAILISPWSKGGRVNSELFDHTSVLMFLEARFGVRAPNITPWRRSVCGDLTSAFNFSETDTSWQASLPNTDDYMPQTRKSCMLPLPLVPQYQTLPRQEEGQRTTCALPYKLSADVQVTGELQNLIVTNSGTRGAVFRLSGQGAARQYTVGAGHTQNIPLQIEHDFTLHGPAGFYRAGNGFSGLQVQLLEEHDGVRLVLKNVQSATAELTVEDAYGPAGEWTTILPSGQETSRFYPLVGSDFWYDLTVTSRSGKTEGHVHLAGRVETGRPGKTDPLMARRS